MDVPLGDPLYKVKSELWKKYSLPTVNNAPGFSSSGNFFTLKLVLVCSSARIYCFVWYHFMYKITFP